MTKELGRLERVELREIWEKEDTHFTPWLAREENLQILGEAIGLELELEAQEQNVGPFRADILCKDTVDGSLVLIENQIERTDHTHLGQLMTYAAGLDAVSIVWIAAKFTEEHRSALDWLNRITEKEFHFFGLEVEVWRIGDSAPAPNFKIISKPNDWSRNVARAARGIAADDLTPTQKLQLKFWTGFADYLEQNSKIKPRSPYAGSWHNFALGKSNVAGYISINARDGKLTTGVHLVHEMKDKYEILYVRKDEIEASLGENLIWMESKTERFAAIELEFSANVSDENDWPNQFRWLQEKMEAFDRVFRPIVKDF